MLVYSFCFLCDIFITFSNKCPSILFVHKVREMNLVIMNIFFLNHRLRMVNCSVPVSVLPISSKLNRLFFGFATKEKSSSDYNEKSSVDEKREVSLWINKLDEVFHYKFVILSSITENIRDSRFQPQESKEDCSPIVEGSLQSIVLVR